MTEYSLEFVRSSRRELERLPATAIERVIRVVRGLTRDPRPRGSQKLVGSSATYRVRVGVYRVIYEVDDQAKNVLVTRVRHRRDAYV